MTDIIDFGPVTQNKSIIKVIGVGGGGGNAVNHMYREHWPILLCLSIYS